MAIRVSVWGNVAISWSVGITAVLFLWSFLYSFKNLLFLSILSQSVSPEISKPLSRKPSKKGDLLCIKPSSQGPSNQALTNTFNIQICENFINKMCEEMCSFISKIYSCYLTSSLQLTAHVLYFYVAIKIVCHTVCVLL